MQHKAGRLLVAIGAVAIIAACSTMDSPHPITGPRASGDVVVTDYGTVQYDENGAPFATVDTMVAKIEHQRTYIDATDCDSVDCVIEYQMYHDGLWFGTSQTLTWSVNSNGNTEPAETGDACVDTQGGLCKKKAADNYHDVHQGDACNWTANGSTDHQAWYAGVWPLGAARWIFFGYGKTTKSSTAPQTKSSCSSSGSGGTPNDQDCYDVFSWWIDEGGFHEQFLFHFCGRLYEI